MIPSNALMAARQYLAAVLANARCVVDATAGNGNDTLFLCKQTPADCRVFAFDVQLAAIRSATELITKHGFLDKVRWLHADHAQLANHVDGPVDAALFNLGYLPGQDHSITTSPASLAPALQGLVDLLAPGGRITLVAYPGHEPGLAEIDFLETTLSRYSQQQFVVTRLNFINQCNNPAILYTIGKARRDLNENSSSN